MKQIGKILIVEPDAEAAQEISVKVGLEFSYRIVALPQDAEVILDAEPYEILMCADDFKEESGLMFLARIRDKWPDMRRILMVPNLNTGELFFDLMQDGSGISYLNKPVDGRELMRVLHKVAREPSIRQEEVLETMGQDPPKTVDFIQILALGTVALVLLGLLVALIAVVYFILHLF